MHNNLPLLPGKMEINKCEKRVCTLYQKKKYVAHIRALKQKLNHRLILKKEHNVI